MYKDKKIIAIIPARSGSKGLPNKNIKEMNGKPLIAWSILSGLKSKLIDKLIVSTDSEEYAEISKKYGADVPFIRPTEISTDKSTSADVVLHSLEFFKSKGEEYDYIILLEPTSPLRKKDDIDNAIKTLIDDKSGDSLVSLGEVHLEHPNVMQIVEKGYVKGFQKEEKVLRRQDLSKIFFPYGVIYMCEVNKYFESNTFYNDNTLPYFIERWQNYEIDDIYDFLVIEKILEYEVEKI